MKRVTAAIVGAVVVVCAGVFVDAASGRSASARGSQDLQTALSADRDAVVGTWVFRGTRVIRANLATLDMTQLIQRVEPNGQTYDYPVTLRESTAIEDSQFEFTVVISEERLAPIEDADGLFVETLDLEGDHHGLDHQEFALYLDAWMQQHLPGSPTVDAGDDNDGVIQFTGGMYTVSPGGNRMEFRQFARGVTGIRDGDTTVRLGFLIDLTATATRSEP